MTRETLVLLPGMMCDARLFLPQIDFFRSRFDILCRPMKEANTISKMAEAALDSVVARQFNLVGLSMGGIVAMRIAGLAPERVKKLALLDTNHRADPPERRRIRERQIADVRKGELRRVIVDEMKPNYLAGLNRGNRLLLDLLVDMALKLGPDVFINQSLALRDRTDQTNTLRTYSGPTLVLCGAEDIICPPKLHRDIAALMQQADFVKVRDAGHISTLENPAAVIAALNRWLGIQ